MSQTLFERLISGELPTKVIYQDELVFAFPDINPVAPTHVLVVPKKPIPRIAEAKEEDQVVLGQLLLKAASVAEMLGLEKTGYRLVINNGRDGGETVPHLHCHILGGRTLRWPPG